MYWHHNFDMWQRGGWEGFGIGWLFFLAPFLVIFVLWSVFWKGLALWHAARRHHPWWFVILLVVNTAGILEIIFLFFILKIRFKDLFKKEHVSSSAK